MHILLALIASLTRKPTAGQTETHVRRDGAPVTVLEFSFPSVFTYRRIGNHDKRW